MKKNNIVPIALAILCLITGSMQAAADDGKGPRPGALTFKPGAPGTIRQPKFEQPKFMPREQPELEFTQGIQKPSIQESSTSSSSENHGERLEKAIVAFAGSMYESFRKKPIFERRAITRGSDLLGREIIGWSEGDHGTPIIEKLSIRERWERDLEFCRRDMGWGFGTLAACTLPFAYPLAILVNQDPRIIEGAGHYTKEYVAMFHTREPASQPQSSGQPSIASSSGPSSPLSMASLLDLPGDDPKFYFAQRAAVLLGVLEGTMHPLLHRKGETQPEGWQDKLWKGLDHLCDGNLPGMAQETRRVVADVTASPNVRIGMYVGAGMLGHSAGIGAAREVLSILSGDMEEENGNRSMNILAQAFEGARHDFPDWHPDHGLTSCSLLGSTSRGILTAMMRFIGNIRESEQRTGYSYFSKEDSDRIVAIISAASGMVCRDNLRAAQAKASCDERALEPCLNLMHKLVAIPTKSHDVFAAWEKNQSQIDELFEALHPENKHALAEWMNELGRKADSLHYTYRDGDAGINYILAGLPGIGKTFVMKKIPPLLGYPLIEMPLSDITRPPNAMSISTLLRSEELSSLEEKILVPNADKTGGCVPANPLAVMDEFDRACDYNAKQLAAPFDQYGCIKLPCINVKIRSFLNPLMGTNCEVTMDGDDALKGRFFQSVMMPKNFTQTRRLVWAEAEKELSRHPKLIKEHGWKFFERKITEYVRYKFGVNMKRLIDNVGKVINYFNLEMMRKDPTQLYRYKYLIPETYEEFLERIFRSEKIIYTYDEHDEPVRAGGANGLRGKATAASASSSTASTTSSSSSSSASSSSSSSSSSRASSSSSSSSSSSASSSSAWPSVSSRSSASSPSMDERRRSGLVFLTGADPSIRVKNFRQEDVPQDD